jgi:hypothetical protein
LHELQLAYMLGMQHHLGLCSGIIDGFHHLSDAFLQVEPNFSANFLFGKGFDYFHTEDIIEWIT